jgi:hypothetical protein
MELLMPVLLPRLRALLCAAAVVLPAVPVAAQVPALPPPLPGDAVACLCLKQSLDEAGADMAAKSGALDAVRAQLQRIDTELAAARSGMDINDAQAVARFRQQLAERDAVFHRATGDTFAASQAATARYNAAVADYNNQCAGRPLPPPPPGPLSCPMR